MKEVTANLISQDDTQLVKLDVTVSAEKIFAEDSTSNILVQTVLSQRVNGNKDSDNFEFSA